MPLRTRARKAAMSRIKDLTLADLGRKSVRRNALVPGVLHRIDFVEGAGTGIRRIGPRRASASPSDRTRRFERRQKNARWIESPGKSDYYG